MRPSAWTTIPSGADIPPTIRSTDPSAFSAERKPVLISLKSRRPALSNTRSSGAGWFWSRTCGPAEAAVAAHAANGDVFGLATGVGVTCCVTGACRHAVTVINIRARAARFAVADMVKLLIDLV